ncbi:MAG: glycerol kinase GlpK [Rhodothermaceae bacterium]|nr:glycerol kinase GlpK [Rhodothermaceae bacterium]
MSTPHLLALDQGTTSCRALVFDLEGTVVSRAQQEFTQYYPQPGWVEHDAAEILDTQVAVTHEALNRADLALGEVAALGITNQRETTVLWNRHTGEPVHRALVWQDRRTTERCRQLAAEGLMDHIREVTGLRPDPYFSGTKLEWLLNHVDGARDAAERGDLLFGTIDTWLLWNLTGGPEGGLHATDVTNASRTLLYDIRQGSWDETMLDALGIPRSVLPTVRPSSGDFGATTAFGSSIAITGIAGDQHAALFGQACFEPGMAKNTYGTGCFLLLNTGTELVPSEHGLLTTLAWDLGDGPTYALEGSVFVAGAAIQWLRDELHLIDAAPDSAYFASKVEETDGVVVVPAFVGLGAPYWQPDARGAVFGLTRGTTKAHLIRATLESLAYQTRDVLDAMTADANLDLAALRVDGAAAGNDLLMQFQADLLGVSVERPANLETTAFGAAALSGLGADVLDQNTLADRWAVDARFEPDMPEADRARHYAGWRRAVRATLAWARDPG